MVMPNDDAVVIRHPDRGSSGEPSVITVSCADKTGLGCDITRVLLLFGINILKGDMSTDGRWCYIVLWVTSSDRPATRWNLLKRRILEVCPVSSPFGIDSSYFSPAGPEEAAAAAVAASQVFLLKFSYFDRTGLLHDVTKVLCEMELTIRRVKVSTTPDGRVLDLFFVTDVRGLLQTKNRKEEVCDNLKSALGDSVMTCEIELATEDMLTCLQASASLPPSVSEGMFVLELPEDSDHHHGSRNLSVGIDNSLSPAHSLLQIQCGDHKGLLYDIMRTLKDYNIQVCYGRFYANARRSGACDIDLFVVQTDGKKIVDPHKQAALCSRLRMELSCPLRMTMVSRGTDTELVVANPVELSGKGRPLVFRDITGALKALKIPIFLAEIGWHVVGDREWELYRLHLGEDGELPASHRRILDGVKKMLMG